MLRELKPRSRNLWPRLFGLQSIARSDRESIHLSVVEDWRLFVCRRCAAWDEVGLPSATQTQSDRQRHESLRASGFTFLHFPINAERERERENPKKRRNPQSRSERKGRNNARSSFSLFPRPPSSFLLGERLNGMIRLSLNARKLCIIHLVQDRTLLAP